MKERIAVDPQIHFGKPCVAGTRIPVQAVLELVREGLSFSEIIRDYYPDLEIEDVRAVISRGWTGRSSCRRHEIDDDRCPRYCRILCAFPCPAANDEAIATLKVR